MLKKKLKSNTAPISSDTSKAERKAICSFWLSLDVSSRKKILRINTQDLIKRIKEKHKHICSCNVCGRKRAVIDREVERLYEQYLEELEIRSQKGIPPLPAQLIPCIRNKVIQQQQQQNKKNANVKRSPRLPPPPPSIPDNLLNSKLQQEKDVCDEDSASMQNELEDELLDLDDDLPEDFNSWNFGRHLVISQRKITVSDDWLKDNSFQVIDLFHKFDQTEDNGESLEYMVIGTSAHRVPKKVPLPAVPQQQAHHHHHQTLPQQAHPPLPQQQHQTPTSAAILPNQQHNQAIAAISQSVPLIAAAMAPNGLPDITATVTVAAASVSVTTQSPQLLHVHNSSCNSSNLSEVNSHHSTPIADGDGSSDCEEDDDSDYDNEDDEENDEDDEDDEDDDDGLAENKKWRESRRMFRLYAAKLFFERIVLAWKEKKALEMQEVLFQEEERQKQKAMKKIQQQQQREAERERERKEKEKLEAELKQREEERREEERKLREEEKHRKAEEKRKAEQTALEQAMKKAEEERMLREQEMRRLSYKLAVKEQPDHSKTGTGVTKDTTTSSKKEKKKNKKEKKKKEPRNYPIKPLEPVVVKTAPESTGASSLWSNVPTRNTMIPTQSKAGSNKSSPRKEMPPPTVLSQPVRIQPVIQPQLQHPQYPSQQPAINSHILKKPIQSPTITAFPSDNLPFMNDHNAISIQSQQQHAGLHQQAPYNPFGLTAIPLTNENDAFHQEARNEYLSELRSNSSVLRSKQSLNHSYPTPLCVGNSQQSLLKQQQLEHNNSYNPFGHHDLILSPQQPHFKPAVVDPTYFQQQQPPLRRIPTPDTVAPHGIPMNSLEEDERVVENEIQNMVKKNLLVHNNIQAIQRPPLQPAISQPQKVLPYQHFVNSSITQQPVQVTNSSHNTYLNINAMFYQPHFTPSAHNPYAANNGQARQQLYQQESSYSNKNTFFADSANKWQ